jgi:hypothetical protein
MPRKRANHQTSEEEPMTMSLTRRSIAALVIAGGLLLAALGAAPEANAGTIYVCVKKNGTVRFVSQSTKCKKKEKKLSWNTEGLAGKNGANGLNGANGANGAAGLTGPPGPFVDTLPAGKSEKGSWAVLENGKTGAVYGAQLSFPIPLASAATVHYIPAGASPPSGCSGNLAAPAAAPGNLCVFEGFAPIQLNFLEFYNNETAEQPAKVAGKTGALVVFTATGEGTAQAVGTFAVTQ